MPVVVGVAIVMVAVIAAVRHLHSNIMWCSNFLSINNNDKVGMVLDFRKIKSLSSSRVAIVMVAVVAAVRA